MGSAQSDGATRHLLTIRQEATFPFRNRLGATEWQGNTPRWEENSCRPWIKHIHVQAESRSGVQPVSVSDPLLAKQLQVPGRSRSVLNNVVLKELHKKK